MVIGMGTPIPQDITRKDVIIRNAIGAIGDAIEEEEAGVIGEATEEEEVGVIGETADRKTGRTAADIRKINREINNRRARKTMIGCTKPQRRNRSGMDPETTAEEQQEEAVAKEPSLTRQFN